MGLGQGKGQSRDAPGIYLAAFGKHPGWDDHIEDIGIETDLLAQVRRWFYIEGISGNIDSGAWEKLGEEQRLAGFAHEFVWWFGPAGRDPAQVVVGRLWSSQDGKGRSKYPMAVYAQGTGIPISAMVRDVLPALGALERKCIEASSAAAVRMVIDQTRTDLRSWLAAHPEAAEKQELPADALTPTQVGELTDRAELGQKTGSLREGLARTLYAVERELGAFLPIGGDGRKSKSVSVQAAVVKAGHLRLPTLASGGSESCLAWISLISRRLSEGSAILAINPRGEKFVDVLVGEPGASQFYCMRASAKGFPLTTEVPYAIDEAFRGRAGDMVAKWSGREPAPAAIAAAAPAPVAPAASTDSPNSDKGSGIRKWLFGGAAGVIVLGGVVVAIMAGGDDKPGTTGDGIKVAIKDEPADSEIGTGPPASTGKVNTPPTPQPDPGQAARDKEAADKAVADKVAADKAAADKAAADQAARETADRARREQDERDRQAKEIADRQERERTEEADRQAKAREAQEQESKAKEARDREALAKAAKDDADRLEKDRLAREAKDKEDRDAKERASADARSERAKVERILTQVGQLIADGAGAGDAAAEGKSVQGLYDSARASAEFGALANGEIGKSIADRIGALNRIDQSNDQAFLSSAAGDVSAGKLGVALAAAHKLSQPGDRAWPATAAQAQQAQGIVGGLRSAAGQIMDPARNSEVAGRIDGISRGFWMNRWKSVDRRNDSEVAGVLAAMEPMGVSGDSLPAGDRFNILLGQYWPRFAAASGDSVRTLASQWIADAGKIQDLPGDGAKQIAALTAALAEAEAAGKSGPPLETIGPGALSGDKRWRLASSSARGATFAPPAGSKIQQPVEFIRIQTRDGVAYVQAQEMSLGLLDDLVGELGNWPDLARLARLEVKSNLGRAGPVVWDWDIAPGGQARGMKPAAQRNRENSRGWFDFENSGAAYFEPGKEPKAPGLKHPVQYVSPAAAIYVARLVGCRLPTVEEAGLMIAMSTDSQPNRRDASWMAAMQHLARTSAAKNPRWFDGGIFIPADASQVKRKDRAVAATEQDDGTVLFRDVDSGGSAGLQDAVGNVSEFVFEDAASQAALPQDPGALKEAVQKTTAIRIVGGSALSPPEVDPTHAYSIRTDAGFSDVGFRLAFAVEGGVAGGNERLHEAIRRLAMIGP